MCGRILHQVVQLDIRSHGPVFPFYRVFLMDGHVNDNDGVHHLMD